MKARWGPALLPRLRTELVRDARGIVDRMDTLQARAAAAGVDPEALQAATEVDADRVRAAAATTQDRMAHAELIWVAEDMAAVALDASSDIPSADPESAPWRAGLMVFERPLPPLPAGPLTLQDGTQWDGEAPVEAISWHYDTDHLWVSRYCRAATLRVQDGELQETAGIAFPRGRTLDLSAEEAALAATGHQIVDVRLLAFLTAAWSMMLTPTVARRRSLDLATGAVTRAEGPPTTDPRGVTLIDLRPMRHVDTDREPGESGRVYRHRWIVRGHWREQPHGPGQSLRRTTWVASYTKGPAGAPLLATEKVLVWRR